MRVLIRKKVIFTAVLFFSACKYYFSIVKNSWFD